MRIAIARLRRDGGTQPRGVINYTVVEEYKQEMLAGAKFPPVIVYHDGTNYWLADGFHRVEAALAARLDKIDADVRAGTREDAVWFSCSANQAHGVRRTNADKRRAVETALKLKPDASDRAIAEHVGVGHQLIATVRAEIAPPRQLDESSSSKRVGRDGKARTTTHAKQAAGGKASAAKRARQLSSDDSSLRAGCDSTARKPPLRVVRDPEAREEQRREPGPLPAMREVLTRLPENPRVTPRAATPPAPVEAPPPATSAACRNALAVVLALSPNEQRVIYVELQSRFGA